MATLNKMDDLAAELWSDFGRLKSLRTNFESHWQEIAQRMIPNDSFIFQQEPGSFTKGEKRTQELIDSTAMLALEKFAAIMDSLLTPRNSKWHTLAIKDDPILARNRQVKIWLEDVNAAIFRFRYAPESNFVSQNVQHNIALGGYGTGSTFIDQLATGKGIRYRAIHLSELFMRENHQGLVDTVKRYFVLTGRQAAQWFGIENLPDQMRTAMAMNPDQDFKFLHCVKPREEYDPRKVDSLSMPWASYYISELGQKMVAVGGFRSFPYAVSRYMQSTNEVYGRSPAMTALPAIKTLNEEKKSVLKAAHRAVDPTYLAFDDGIIDTFNAQPGYMNAGGVTADGRPLVHTLPSGDPRIGKELMDDERNDIREAFLVNLFQILTETPEMTATEVIERTREKGILLTPIVGRQESEKLGPMIKREIDVMAMQGLIPPMPPILAERQGQFEYDVEYNSPLSRAQRAEEASGTLRTVESAINVAAQTGNPEPLDHFDWDVIIPEVASINGVPEKWLRDPEVVAQIRAQRAQAQQIQQATQIAPGLAAMTKANAVADKKGA